MVKMSEMEKTKVAKMRLDFWLALLLKSNMPTIKNPCKAEKLKMISQMFNWIGDIKEISFYDEAVLSHQMVIYF